jgi:hypothetical protein
MLCGSCPHFLCASLWTGRPIQRLSLRNVRSALQSGTGPRPSPITVLQNGVPERRLANAKPAARSREGRGFRLAHTVSRCPKPRRSRGEAVAPAPVGVPKAGRIPPKVCESDHRLLILGVAVPGVVRFCLDPLKKVRTRGVIHRQFLVERR